MTVIVDPANENYAIVDGALATAVRFGRVADPTRPTVAELNAMPIVGYGQCFIDAREDT